MKRLILCADNRTPYTDEDVFYKHCIQNTQKYARSKGFDFRFDLLTEMEDRRYWPWLKIKSVLKFVDYYDMILWMDSDASVFNHNLDVFDVIRNGPNYDTWKRNKDCLPVIYMLKDCGAGLCTGIFLVDCTNKQKAKMVLNRWWNDMLDSRYKNTFPWEQYVINDVWSIHEDTRNFIKGVDIWSFSLRDSRQAFIHMTSGLYRYHQQLHEAKRLSVVQKHETVGILISLDFHAFQSAVFKKQELELQGYIVLFLVEGGAGITNRIYRNYNVLYMGINNISKDIKTIYSAVNRVIAGVIPLEPVSWTPMLMERVRTPYMPSSTTLNIVLHGGGCYLRMATLYAITLGYRIHFYGGVDTSLLRGFDLTHAVFHTEDLETVLRKLEQTGERIVVLSNGPTDYCHSEVVYRGIPLFHNSSFRGGHYYDSLSGLKSLLQ